jgi:NAD(P)-dependent dehydrogenase (short-subunit alcohol dehydrogenase family)
VTRPQGKVAVVTGASSGIGEAAAKALAAQGASVVLASRRTAELDRVADGITAAGGTAVSVRTDVTSDDDLENAVRAAEEHFGGLDIAFDNASQLGVVGFGAGLSAYVAGKHGVVGLTKTAALEYAPHNIRVNALALASVDTPMYRSSVRASEEMTTYFNSLHPLGRIATVTEAASAVAYLAGDDAAFFTGSVLAMDGGWTAQ